MLQCTVCFHILLGALIALAAAGDLTGTSLIIPSAFIGSKLAHPRDGTAENLFSWLAL